MYMRIDIMTDLETLGVQKDSTIFQISAAAFDIKTGIVIDTLNLNIDISKQPIKADGSTIKWWLDTNKELFEELINCEGMSHTDALLQLQYWIRKHKSQGEVYLWGNGILFDNNMIKTQMELLGMEYPIKFRNDRDMRTILELAAIKEGISEHDLRDICKRDELEKHNALHDVLFQIDVVSCCYNILVGENK